MLEKIDLKKKLSKEEYKRVAPDLEIRLGQLQRKIKEHGIPVIIVFEGWGAAGKGTLINKFLLPLDPRGIQVLPTLAPNEEQTLRPFLWRFWIHTPERGRIHIFDRSWYRRVLKERVDDGVDSDDLRNEFDDIRAFERKLTADGTVIVKFFLHISQKEQQKRFRKLEKNPALAWRVNETDWKENEQYEDYVRAVDEMIERTDTGHARWTIVEATDERFATIKIFQGFIHAMEDKLAEIEPQQEAGRADAAGESARSAPVVEGLNASILDKVDLSGEMLDEEYRERKKKCQSRLRELEHELYIRRIPLMIVYEGWDAAGKGGNIRRLVQTLDPRGYEVVPISAPNDIEKAHHYLWRFWIRIPKAGHVTIFDRSWYGRVMVERIEGFCSRVEWRRAYREINEMEGHLTNFGAILIKFWLQIDRDEQIRRFRERENIPHKRWKITSEDWRNREKWDDYRAAVDEMLYRTSTTYAPWTVVESNCKRFARIKAMQTVIERVEQRLEG
ncbi:MAG: phosphate--AMP phosphotransferase [Deltaproteobacteria bacterium]|nr:phosphate--AMP phosphotransferase [Deltaproteobacteria bacterium]